MRLGQNLKSKCMFSNNLMPLQILFQFKRGFPTYPADASGPYSLDNSLLYFYIRINLYRTFILNIIPIFIHT